MHKQYYNRLYRRCYPSELLDGYRYDPSLRLEASHFAYTPLLVSRCNRWSLTKNGKTCLTTKITLATEVVVARSAVHDPGAARDECRTAIAGTLNRLRVRF